MYAFVMGWPDKLTLIRPLATSSALRPAKIRHVELLGYQDRVRWTQDEQGLTVVMPEHKPCDYAITLKIT
jgi:alpha-L-fucosidase